MERKTKRVIVILSLLISGVIFLLFILFIVNLWNFKPIPREKRFQDGVNYMNKKIPLMLDSITRFDSASYLPKDTVVYHNTFLGLSNGDIDTARFVSVIHPEVLQQIKKEKKSDYFKRLKAVFLFRYQYEDGQLIKDVIVTPEQYK